MSCATCSTTDKSTDPTYQPNLVEVIAYTIYPERYVELYVCRCKGCGKEQYVQRDISYHYPTFYWTESKSYAEQLCGESIEEIIRKNKK